MSKSYPKMHNTLVSTSSGAAQWAIWWDELAKNGQKWWNLFIFYSAISIFCQKHYIVIPHCTVSSYKVLSSSIQTYRNYLIKRFWNNLRAHSPLRGEENWCKFIFSQTSFSILRQNFGPKPSVSHSHINFTTILPNVTC